MRIIITLIPNKKKKSGAQKSPIKNCAKTPLPKSDPNTSLKDTDQSISVSAGLWSVMHNRHNRDMAQKNT